MRRLVLFCVLLVAFGIIADQAHCTKSSNFANVSLANRISVDLPRSWYVLTDQGLQLFETWYESFLSNASVSYNKSGVLVMCLHREPYAQATITMEKGNYSQVNIQRASLSDIKRMDTGFKSGTKESCRMQNMKFIKWYETRKTLINGRYAVTYEYLRQSKGNRPSFVQVNNIFPDRSTKITLILSYQEDSRLILKPILDRIKRSFMVR